MIVSDGNREYWECFGWKVVREYWTKSGNRYFIMEHTALDEQEDPGAPIAARDRSKGCESYTPAGNVNTSQENEDANQSA